jgi:hypothetical protein
LIFSQASQTFGIFQGALHPVAGTQFVSQKLFGAVDGRIANVTVVQSDGIRQKTA